MSNVPAEAPIVGVNHTTCGSVSLSTSRPFKWNGATREPVPASDDATSPGPFLAIFALHGRLRFTALDGWASLPFTNRRERRL